MTSRAARITGVVLAALFLLPEIAVSQEEVPAAIQSAYVGPPPTRLMRSERGSLRWVDVWGGLAFLQEGYIYAVAVTSDGARVLTASSTGACTVFDAETGARIAAYRGHRGTVGALALHPDGAELATAGSHEPIRLWNPRTGAEGRSLGADSVGGIALAYSPDGTRLAVMGPNHLRLWDPASGTLVCEGNRGLGWFAPIAWSPDGRWIVTSGDDGVTTWSPETATPMFPTADSKCAANCVALSPDGENVLIAGGDRRHAGMFEVWNAPATRVIRRLTGGSSSFMAMLPSPDGARVVLIDSHGGVFTWDRAGDGADLVPAGNVAGSVMRAAFHPDGRRVFVGCNDNRLRCLDLRTGSSAPAAFDAPGAITDLAPAPDGSRVISTDDAGCIRAWAVSGGRAGFAVRAEAQWLRAVSVSPDGQRFATGGILCPFQLWDAETGQPQLPLGRPKHPVNAIAYSRDGTWFACGQDDSTVVLRDATTGKSLRVLAEHDERVYSVAVSPRENILASSSQDHTIRLWNPETGELLRTLDTRGSATQLAFGPDGARLYASVSGHLVAWQISTGETALQVKAHELGVRCLGVSDDGRWLYSGGGDRKIRVWDARDGKPLDTVESDATPCALVVIGDRIHVGCANGSVCVYEHRP